MFRSKVFASIMKAIRSGKLKEPFSTRDFRNACKGFGDGTYTAFLYKHSKGNSAGHTELFEKVAKGQFKLLQSR